LNIGRLGGLKIYWTKPAIFFSSDVEKNTVFRYNYKTKGGDAYQFIYNMFLTHLYKCLLALEGEENP
jgi:hypothetical protein